MVKNYIAHVAGHVIVKKKNHFPSSTHPTHHERGRRLKSDWGNSTCVQAVDEWGDMLNPSWCERQAT
jgi:hypothetical protein